MHRALVAALAAVVSLSAQSQQWPAKPVRLVSNFAPGGLSDAVMRPLAAGLTQTFGQPFIVENRAGADGYIGFDEVARSEPDGYTLCFTSGSAMMILPSVKKREHLNPLKVLAPVAPTARPTLYLVTDPGFPPASLTQLLAYLRANPGKVNYATPGNTTMSHIAASVFGHETGTTLVHVAYKGLGGALQDLMGGRVQLAFAPGVVLPHAKSGRLRLLAVAGPRRNPGFPDAPTLEESGIRGVDGGPYFGLYAPANTPRPIVERLNQEVNRLMQESAMRERMSTVDAEISEPMTSAAFAAYVRAQSEHYARLLPALGIAE